MAQSDSEILAQTAELEAEQIRLAGDDPMEEEELEGIIAGLIDEASDYIDQTEALDRNQANDYYQGRPFGNEEEGRSQVISRDVRDTIALMLPQIMRTFFGSERVVEFQPRGPEDVPVAEQASDFVNQVVLSQDNEGFSTFYNIFHDSLVKRVGVAKVDWEKREEIEHEEYTGLDDMSLEALVSDPNIEASSVESYPDPSYVPPPQPTPEEMAAQQNVSPGGSPPPQQPEPPMLHDVVIRRIHSSGKITLESLPPEEFIIDRKAKGLGEDEFTICGHRRYLTVSELTSMGYDYEEMLSLASEDDGFGTNTELLSRNPVGNYADSLDAGDASKKVLYVEAFAKVDFAGSGIAGLRRFCCAGTHHKVLHHSPVSSVPFQIFSGILEPHLWKGHSIAALTSDIQKIKSNVLRSILDSLSKSVHPDTWMVEGAVSLDDLSSNRVGKIVRTRAPGMIGELNKSFNGKEGFPMLDYLDNLREDRTGMSKASMGLDPSALQSTTKAAVSATVAASQAQIELLCRVFAETGMKPLFKKILKLLHTHQDKPRMVRLRNEWVQVDPQTWNQMDVSVNVALGLGTNEERMQMLAGLAAKQEKILETQGPENPLCNFQQYHHTLAKMTELSGYKDVMNFWTDPKTYQAPPPPPPPEPTPDEIFAKAQADKATADITRDQEKLALEREKMIREDDLNRDKLDAEIAMKKDELESKYNITIDQTEIRGQIEKDRERIKLEQMQANQGQQGPPPMPPQDMNPQQMGPPMPDFPPDQMPS